MAGYARINILKFLSCYSCITILKWDPKSLVTTDCFY
jgi:hypothetical protein